MKQMESKKREGERYRDNKRRDIGDIEIQKDRQTETREAITRTMRWDGGVRSTVGPHKEQQLILAPKEQGEM